MKIFYERNHLELEYHQKQMAPIHLWPWGSSEMKMVYKRNFLGSPCLFRCLITRKTTQAFKNHCYLTHIGSHDCGKWCVLLSCTSSLHTCTSEGIKIGNLDFFLRPSSDQTPFRTCSSYTHFEKRCQGNLKQRRLHALKAGKCIRTSNLYTLLLIDSLFPFSSWSFKEQSLRHFTIKKKSGIESKEFFLLSSGYFSSVFAIISQFIYSKVNITIMATLHLKKWKA